MNAWSIAWKEFAHVAGALVIIVAVISVVAGLMREYIPQDKVRRRMSNQGRWGSVVGAGLGTLTPFCSASMVPVAMGMMEMGIPFGTILSFLFAAPVTNFVVVGIILAVFGWKITLAYVIWTFGGAVIAGMVLGNSRLKNDIKPIKVAPQQCCGAPTPVQSKSCTAAASTTCSSDSHGSTPSVDVLMKDHYLSVALGDGGACTAVAAAPAKAASPCCGGAPTTELRQPVSSCSALVTSDVAAVDSGWERHKPRVKSSLSFAKVLFLRLLPYILGGAAISAATAAFVPDTIVQRYLGSQNIVAIPFAAAIGVPLYLRIEVAIPLLKVLIAKGMGLGAAMALLIGGTGASLPELAILLAMLKPRAVAVYAFAVFVIATTGGLMFRFLI